MYIYLPEVKAKSGEAFVYSFQNELSDCFDDFRETGSLNLSIEAFYSDSKIMLRGKLQISVDTFCSRCLEPFRSNFETDFIETFTLLAETPADDDPDLQALEAANMQTVSGDYLYLAEYIRQLIILAQEYNPLCNPGCKGICAGCGEDLNKTPCRCDIDHNIIDVRLLKLKELRSGS